MPAQKLCWYAILVVMKLLSIIDYNLFVIIVSIILSVLSIGGVGVYSHYEIKKRMREYDPDSIV